MCNLAGGGKASSKFTTRLTNPLRYSSNYDLLSTWARKSPSALKVVYIVSQSDVELELDTPSSCIVTATALSQCNDKVISVHMSKAAANAAAKQHLRRICRVKSKKDAKAKMEAGGYYEGVGTKGLFVGSMKMKEEYVRVETQWWEAGK